MIPAEGLQSGGGWKNRPSSVRWHSLCYLAVPGVGSLFIQGEAAVSGKYQARWISKQRRDALKRTGALKNAILLDSFNGFLVVEPIGGTLGDGAIIPAEAADYELSPVWCLDAKSKLTAARRLLGLEPDPQDRALATVG
jgi:hypothetical protein